MPYYYNIYTKITSRLVSIYLLTDSVGKDNYGFGTVGCKVPRDLHMEAYVMLLI